jgi:hypothetical protein
MLNNVLKWHAFTLASVRSSTASRVSQGRTLNKIIKRRAIKGKDKSVWGVLTSSPVFQKKKLKARYWKNNFSKWFTIQTRASLIKIMTVSAVNNARNTAM